MTLFKVPITTVTTEIFHVKAETAEEAMHLALEDDDEDYCHSIDVIEGDPECYYPDIVELRDGDRADRFTQPVDAIKRPV